MRAWGVLATTALVAGLIGFAGPGAQADPSPAPTPVVHGNQLLDSRTDSIFVPHGANWPSFEYACSASHGRGWGYSQGDDTVTAADAMASWQINTVRIPLNQDCWLGLNAKHNYGTATGYRAAVKAWVDILNSHGIVAILDLHWNAPRGKLAEGQYAMPDAQSLTFWSSVARAYASNPSVIFDAFNEPFSRWSDASHKWVFQLTWNCWQHGGCHPPDVDQNTKTDGHTYKAVGMSAIVAAIRAAGAPQPVMLGGLDYSNDLTQWLTHRPHDSQLIASWHNYPGQACDTVDCWNSAIAPVAAQVPVLAGETGETDGTATFLATFMTWADAHGIGYLPWAWWEVDPAESGDNALYALVTGPDFAAKAPAGTALKSHLLALPAPSASGVDASALDLRNPGFEGSIAGWRAHSNEITLASGTHPERAHSGTGYLSATAKKAGRGFEQVVSTTPAVGDDYRASLWLRTNSASSEKVQLTLATEGGTEEYASTTVTRGKTWTRYTLDLSVGKTGHTGIRITAYLKSAKRGIYADDASVTLTR